jgi:hypothetical protein
MSIQPSIAQNLRLPSVVSVEPRRDFEEVRRSFLEQGYFVFRNVVSKEKLSEVRAKVLDEYDRVCRSGTLLSGGGRISGHLNCSPGEAVRFVYDTLCERGIIDIAKAIVPRAAGALRVGCNLNLPGSVEQHYHADGLFLEDFVIVNVAAVDTDIQNGAIDVLPGTHRKFYKYWRFAYERPYRKTTRLALGQGDVLIRTSNLWHRGMPNFTATPRPMLAFTLGEKPDEKGRDPFQANGGGITFESNWYADDFLGRLRERTFVKAPFTYNAWRFVRSLYGNKGYAAW